MESFQAAVWQLSRQLSGNPPQSRLAALRTAVREFSGQLSSSSPDSCLEALQAAIWQLSRSSPPDYLAVSRTAIRKSSRSRFPASLSRRSVVAASLSAVRGCSPNSLPLPLRPALLGGGILFSLESSLALPLTACVPLKKKNPPRPAQRGGRRSYDL